MDVGIRNEKGIFKLRACGIIYQDGKVLVDTARNFEGYIFIGGHIELGENSRKGVVREVFEEIGIKTEILKLICVNENLFKLPDDKDFHEIAYYYLLKPIIPLETKDFDYTEIDKGVTITHHYKWFGIDELKKKGIRPQYIVDMIKENKENYYLLTDQKEANE